MMANLSYTDVNRMSVKRLNEFCLQFGIDIKLPKNSKINAICHCLDISPSGAKFDWIVLPRTAELLSQSQLDELQQLTPAKLYQLQDWSSDISQMPVLDDMTVKKFLLQTNEIDDSMGRTYKLSRPYQLQKFVHSVQINGLNMSSFFSVIRARCNPSQSTDKDEVKLVHVLLDKSSGQPYGGYCTCTVGYAVSVLTFDLWTV